MKSRTAAKLNLGRISMVRGGGCYGWATDLDDGVLYFIHRDGSGTAKFAGERSEWPLVVSRIVSSRDCLRVGQLVRFLPGKCDRGPRTDLWVDADEYLNMKMLVDAHHRQMEEDFGPLVSPYNKFGEIVRASKTHEEPASDTEHDFQWPNPWETSSGHILTPIFDEPLGNVQFPAPSPLEGRRAGQGWISDAAPDGQYVPVQRVTTYAPNNGRDH